tara:strand:+ start:6341 stop:6727 length:387 start_codon:yes stop_codon:yes gene_type:complete
MWWRKLVQGIHAYFIASPLKHLYLYGPSLGGYGFWNGKNEMDICAEMTGVPSDVWAINMENCQQHIDRHFNALIVSTNFVLYLGFVWVSWKTLLAFIGKKRGKRKASEPEVLYIMMPPPPPPPAIKDD